MLIVGIVLSFLNKKSWPTYGASFVCLVFVFLSEFKTFEAFGVIKAETRLEAKIKETDEIIQRLRSLTLPIAEMLFTMSAQFGGAGAHISNRDKYQFMNRIENELNSIGVDNNKIEKAKRGWHFWTIVCLSSPIIMHLDNLFGNKIRQNPNNIELVTELKKAKQDIYNDSLYDKINKSPLFIENYISSNKLLTKAEKENIFKQFHEEFEDIRYYTENRKFRRLEKWLQEQ